MNAYRPTVLIVDHFLPLHALYGILLSRSGFDSIAAQTGEDALDIYQRSRQTIDLVVSDLRLPGMDGPTILRVLHHVNPALPCFLLNDSSLLLTRASLRQCGCIGVIDKPTQIPEIGRLLRDALDSSSTDDCLMLEVSALPANA